MELLEGVPLSAYTRSGGRVPLAQAATILQGILAGLGAAHAQGIVHRDLKPENVFLAREPNGAFTAKILDFGIAKVMDAAGGMGNEDDAPGVLLGTPAYMSPEQIKNAKDVDARADLWSAGVMLYEMLTGSRRVPRADRVRAPRGGAQHDAAAARGGRSAARAALRRSCSSRCRRIARSASRPALEMARALSAALGARRADAAAAAAQPPARRAERVRCRCTRRRRSPRADRARRCDATTRRRR